MYTNKANKKIRVQVPVENEALLQKKLAFGFEVIRVDQLISVKSACHSAE